MRHPTEGTLRRLLDEADAIPIADREHVAACDGCGRRLAAVRADADLAGTALATTAGMDDDPSAAWRRLAGADHGRVRVQAPVATRAGRLRDAFRRPVAAGVAAVVLLLGAGVAAANGWLQIFQTERIAPIGLSTQDLNALPDLRSYGRVVVTGEPDVHSVPDAAAAAMETGLDVPQVTNLPRGVSGAPAYQVGGEVSVTFTFSANRVARAAAESGEAMPPLPPGLDGSQVRLVAGPGLAASWSDSGAPELVVGRAVAPRAFSSSGVPFGTVRDYLLSLPGLPEDVASALRTFNADGSTLPLPVPSDRVTISSTEIDGVEASVLATRDRSMAAVVWVEDGLVTVVAGALDTDEVVSIGRTLR